jgi:hypothetical protein
MSRKYIALLALAACSAGPADTGVTTDGPTSTGGLTTGADAAPTTASSSASTPTTGASTTGEPSSSTGEPNPTTGDETSGGLMPDLQSSVTQYGITWTFDRGYPVGRFVTGDWWVVGPVTITEVSPAPTAGRNGSMLDPVGSQDYDDRAGNHAPGLRVEYPHTVDGARSLVSSISHPEAPECQQGGSDGWFTYDGDCQRGPIHTQAILTILPAAPPDDAFRPPYAGADKPLHRASDLCWSALPALAAPAELPAAPELLRHVERPWIDHLQSWTMQHGCATHNMYCYGREVGNIVATVATYALVAGPDQQEVARRLVQLGIDNYGHMA